MEIAENVIARFLKERFFDQAAQTAYYLLLSLFPFLLFILSLLSLFPVHEEMLLTFLRPFAPEQSFTLIEKNSIRFLRKVMEKCCMRAWGGVLGFLDGGSVTCAFTGLGKWLCPSICFLEGAHTRFGYHTSFYACHPALIASPDYRKCVAEGNYVL